MSLNLTGYALVVLFGLATLVYMLQVFTPLRLTSDGITYLSFADAAAQGHGFATIHQTYFVFPKGYPTFLFGLMRMGVFSSAALVASNLVFLWLALTLSYKTLISLGFERLVAGTACLLTYLSYATIKHVTQAMSDFLFFFLAALAFWLMTRKSPSKWLAILPCMCAVEVRLLGLALFVPLAFLVWQSAAKRPKILIPLGVLVAACLAIGAWAGQRYFATNTSLLHQYGFGHFVWLSANTHFEDFGQLVINLPWTKLPASSAVLIKSIGAIAFVMFALGAIVLFESSPLISLYLLGCSVLILPWPYTDPRFWLPVMPYIVVAIWKGIVRIRGSVPTWTAAGYTALFSIAGFAALGYSTWITFSGPMFPYRYGDGGLRSAYAARCAATDSKNQDALNLLRRYEWHCEAASDAAKSGR